MYPPVFVFSLAIVGAVGFALILSALVEDWRHPDDPYAGWRSHE